MSETKAEPHTWVAEGKDGFMSWQQSKEIAEKDIGYGMADIVYPLYRQPQPAITDEERELLESAACDADAEAGVCRREYDKSMAEMYERQAVALRRLAERLTRDTSREQRRRQL